MEKVEETNEILFFKFRLSQSTPLFCYETSPKIKWTLRPFQSPPYLQWLIFLPFEEKIKILKNLFASKGSKIFLRDS